jgi:hypothetical protein
MLILLKSWTRPPPISRGGGVEAMMEVVMEVMMGATVTHKIT